MSDNVTQTSDHHPHPGLSSREEIEKRHEQLARRPSYRKILNDLSSSAEQLKVLPKEEPVENPSSLIAAHSLNNVSPQEFILASAIASGSSNSGSPALPVNLHSAKLVSVASHSERTATPTHISTNPISNHAGISIGTSGAAATAQPLPGVTLSVSGAGAANLSADTATTLLQYAVANRSDSQILMPAANQVYQFTTPPSLSQGGVVIPTSGLAAPPQPTEEVARKREMRLMKNREAAKECRRKKKEYVRCLESRVTTLETQNRRLIEELRSLKEMYCQRDGTDASTTGHS